MIHYQSHLGSIHSGRYANVGVFIFEHDTIPRLNQNYGQTLLVATHLILGVKAPFASLTAWVAMALAALALLCYGFFRQVLPTCWRALVATFIVLFCNVALSFTHVLVFDNGSPIGLMGYTDTVSAVGTWLVFCLWLCAWIGNEPGLSPGSLVCPGLLGLFWCMSAPQNIVMGLLLCGGLALSVLARRQPLPGLRGVGAAVVLLLALLVGRIPGGMLMPEARVQETGLPGVMTTSSRNKTGLRTHFGLLFVVSHFGVLRFADSLDNPTYDDLLVQARAFGPDEVYRSQAFRIESLAWTACRMMFFPLVGVCGFCLALCWRERREDAPLLNSRAFGLSAALSLAAGLGLAFLFDYNGFKWEMTRFMIPGAVLGLVALILMSHAAERALVPARWRGLFWMTLLVFCTAGPVLEFGILFHRHFLGPLAREVPVKARLEFLFFTRGYLDTMRPLTVPPPSGPGNDFAGAT
jgi:hypothetical protein